MPFEMDRDTYRRRYGPTAGDRIRLGDTNLIALIERDHAVYGDELVVGWGKTVRAGMMQAHTVARASELDYIVAGAVIIDPVLGIFKGDIGIKDGLIAGTGRAGNPDVMNGVDLVIGPNTVMLSGLNMIATPGAVDTHVHLTRSSLLLWTALSAGVTTFIGGGLQWNGRFILEKYFEALEGVPINMGFQARGSSSEPGPMSDSIEAGACGIKIHEDNGAYPSIIDACLRVADEYDVSVALHTDGLHESMEVTDTIDTIAGRALHAYHVEGCGGGHAPDLLRLTGVPNIIPSSTTPTIPYTVGTYQEHFPMTAMCHGINLHVETDVSALDERRRRETMAAEDVLHDMGAIPIVNSDSQGMGRIGEVGLRTWQLAHKMKSERGNGSEEHDNQRILRYLAKYTINPAVTHGVSSYVGSLEAGKMADIVLWRPEFFGVKPEMVIKGGFPAWAPLGDGNASVPACEPVRYGPTFGGMGRASAATSAYFVSGASLDMGLVRRLDSRRKLLPVRNVRSVTREDMVRNRLVPDIRVDLESNRVSVNGDVVTSDPVPEVPLNRLYFLS